MKATFLRSGATACLVFMTMVAACAAPAPAPRVVAVTDQQNGHSVTLHPGDTLSVTLHDYGDGGYLWYVLWNLGDPLFSPPVLTHNHGSGRPGDFGTDTFRFKALPHGDGEAEWLRFVALRPFEQGISNGTVVQYHVTVAASR